MTRAYETTKSSGHGLGLKVCFVLDAPGTDVIARLGGSMEGTGLRLVRLDADGRTLLPTRDTDTDTQVRGTRWEALLSVPGGPGLTASDVEEFLRRAHAYLPVRSSVVLSGVQPPRYPEPATTSSSVTQEAS